MDCFPLGQVSASIQSAEADGEVIWGNVVATGSERVLDVAAETMDWLCRLTSES